MIWLPCMRLMISALLSLMLLSCTIQTDFQSNPVATMVMIINTTAPATKPVPLVTVTALPPPVPLPTPTAIPTSAPSPTPQPTQPATQIQLTRGGCCVQPFFSADSNNVLFIDKPSDIAPAGIYGLDLTSFVSADASPPVLFDSRIGFYSPDQTVVAFPDAADPQLMRFQHRLTNESWTINTLGNWPVFSADGSRILWNATDRQGPYDERPTDIWVANLNGSAARQVLTLYGGGADGWFPDNERLLITGRSEPIGEIETMAVLSLQTGTTLELAQAKRLRAGGISKAGSWVIYLNTFSDEANQDGLWAIRADGSERKKLPFFGPYHWLDDANLIFIPTRQTPAEGFALARFNVETEEIVQLTDPATLPLSIEGGDWTVSPDGQRVVYVSAVDHNLWLVELPR